ncbi:ABC transporter substrate-binding protein [Alicyclobacillus sp. SO9]|uniref:ABC transporter substrate-binding protein n=1 Tax=Alicyclobacillus sp. SO9 TaxID=2665646 RepID=UPI0018E80A11|nr:extracellular solute-binding protein [Alicyclobacillus sp. SO9]QQE77946.1 extracellular solute-binding protein [Alicyclobacillus sp. SO9]
MMKRLKYGIVSVAVVVGGSLLLSGCGSTNSAQTSNSSGGKNKPFKGTITMYADQYGPSAKVKTTKLTELAKQYEKSHPGITIKFIQVPAGSSYGTWVKTKAAGGQLPDILWEQWLNVNSTLPKNILVNLNPYLKQADPYVSGKTWEQDLNPKLMAQTAAANGDSYLVHGDYVGQGMFYNKADFAKVGISQPPKTWAQFISDSKKLKNAGITPVFLDMSTKGEGEFTWFSRLIYTNLFHNQYNTLRYTGTPALNNEDQVIAIKKGVFSNKNPRWMAFWQMMKNFYPYLEKNATGVSGQGDLAFRAFSTGKAAMYFGGSWTPSQLKSTKVSFKWGTFPDPVPSKTTTKYATSFNSSAAVGGPNGQLQYGIASPKADHKMTTSKEQACVNWLEYITTPKHDSTIVNSKGIFVPTVVGSKPLPSLSSLANLSSQPLESNMGGIDLNQQELDAIFRAFQGYVLGQTSLKSFGNTAEAAMTKAANTLIQQNHWNLSKYGVK